MLKLDPATKTLIPIPSTSLTQANILERTHLQEAIVRSWDAFVSELGYEELFLVGKEVVPHEACNDRIDLLAISRDGRPVIIELKRKRDRLQLLQAISYAAMVSKWDAARFKEVLGATVREDDADLQSLLDDEAFEVQGPEMVLLAESFEPEVILAAEWLAGFGVPITAFSISAVDYRGDTLVSIDQRFPLADVDDVYVARTSRHATRADDTSWDDALENISFPFARRAVDIFRKRVAGSPHRRNFGSIYASSPLGRMSIAFKLNYLKVYTVDQSPESERVVRGRLEPAIAVSPWGNEKTKNSGFTFTINTEQQFDHFLKAVGETVE
jgi:hypothetical protein